MNKLKDTKIFTKDGDPNPDAIDSLPDAPPWRRFDHLLETDEDKRQSLQNFRGSGYICSNIEEDLVNAALLLRRPILIEGPAGCGKTSLAYAVAYRLKLGEVLRWSITSRSTLKEGMYDYDAIARLQDTDLLFNKGQGSEKDSKQEEKKTEGNRPPIEDYLILHPLGAAMAGSSSNPNKPRVLLIDEIDKSDIDLPNDLLHVFEEGCYTIRELVRDAAQKRRQKELLKNESVEHVLSNTSDDSRSVITNGKIVSREFPFVIMTSNGERAFPPPFLRRCLRLTLQNPNQEKLVQIVKRRLATEGLPEGDLPPDISNFIKRFIEEQSDHEKSGKILATDQLLNAIFMRLRRNREFLDPEKNKELLDLLLRSLRE